MNFFQKIAQSFQKKSARHSDWFDFFGYRDLNGSGWHEIKAALAWGYYAQVAPLARGANLITNELSSIEYVIRRKGSDEIIRETDAAPVAKVLRLLNNPNPDKTGDEFIKENGLAYLVCGEVYIVTAGITGPVDMFYVNPAEVIVESDGRMMPLTIRWVNEMGNIAFTRQPDGQYVSADGSKKIYQVMDFNPFYRQGNQRGFSRLSSAYFEIEEYIQGKIQNISMMKRGARPSGALICEDDVSKEQIEIMKDQIKRFYSGGENAGNVMVLSKGREFKPMSMTNKDMDYATLNKNAAGTIYEILEIPQSFYSNDASTYNNKQTDRANLYIFAVIPLAKRLCEEWTKFLIPQFGMGDKGYYITFIEKEISALEPLFDDSNLKKSQSGVFTINELRARYGLPDIGPEGDIIYQPLNLVPVGDEQQPAQQAAVKKALEIRLKAKNYSDVQIKGILDVAFHKK